jgi:hypothetical protein
VLELFTSAAKAQAGDGYFFPRRRRRRARCPDGELRAPASARRPPPSPATTSFPGSSSRACAANYCEAMREGKLARDCCSPSFLLCATGTPAYVGFLHMRKRKLLETVLRECLWQVKCSKNSTSDT